MKEIKRSELKKMIRKEYKEARQWCRLDFGRTYNMMIDTEDGKVWSDVFLDENTYKIYHSDTIFSLSPIGRLATVAETEKAYLAEAVSMLQKSGWTIID